MGIPIDTATAPKVADLVGSQFCTGIFWLAPTVANCCQPLAPIIKLMFTTGVQPLQLFLGTRLIWTDLIPYMCITSNTLLTSYVLTQIFVVGSFAPRHRANVRPSYMSLVYALVARIKAN